MPVGILILLFLGMNTVCWIQSKRYKLNLTKTLKKPKFTVIVPAMNEEKMIRDVVQDFIGQTYKNFEVLIMANNCTDYTAEIARNFSRGDDRIRVFEYDTEEVGKAPALNKALKNSTGNVIVAHDADVRVDFDFLEKLSEYYQDESIVAVQPQYRIENENSNLLTMLQQIEFIMFSTIFNKGKAVLGETALAGGVNFSIRKDILEKIGSWRNHLTEDYLLVDTLLKNGYKVTYADNLVARFQAVLSWDALMKQRSRWIRGHLEITAKTFIRKPTTLFDTLFKISPIYNALIFMLFCLFYAYIFFIHTEVTYFYFPNWMWICGIILHQIILIDVCRQQKYWKGIVLSPIFLIYSLHWMLVLFRIPFVNSWQATKVQRW